MRSSSRRVSEHGNVLFLILIAVVLFAALSYAVTQSSRTGGGDAGRETNLIASAEITQYPAAVKTAIVRMIINGTTYEGLRFNSPSAFSGLSGIETQGVFHPSGGAAAFVNASPDVMNAGTPGTWYFNPYYEVTNIGTADAADGDGNEFIAFLPGIKAAICRRLNEEMGLGTTIPTASAIANTTAGVQRTWDTTTAATSIPTETAIIGSGATTGTTAMAGQVAGCFHAGAAGASDYVYFQVLTER
jgi:hypothetical protein